MTTTAVSPPTPGAPSAALRAVPVRHPGRWVAAVVLLLVLGGVGWSMATNPNFQWDVVGQYFFSQRVLNGLYTTLLLTAVSMLIGVVLGIVLAVMRLSPNPVVSGSSWLYIWFFRGTPVLVQLIFWFNIGLLYKSLPLGFTTVSLNSLISPLVAAILGLGLNEAAYMAEIVRAGIISVDAGQTEAASALGMTRLQAMRRIVLPQAIRVIIPPTGNETISMLKTSSLASTIAVTELLYSVQLIYSVTFQTIPLLMVAVLWYLFCTSILTVGQYYIERHYARGSARELPQTPLQRLRRLAFTFHAPPPVPPLTPPGQAGGGR